MIQPLPFVRHSSRATAKNQLTVFDRVMFVIALVGPILTIPQVVLVWSNGPVKGVSLSTWGTYTVVSALWLSYGIVHRQRPLILSQILLVGLDAAVVVGVLTHR